MNIVYLLKDKKTAEDACYEFKKSLFIVPVLKDLVVKADYNGVVLINGDQIYFCHNEFQICGLTIDKLEVVLDVPEKIVKEFELQMKACKSERSHVDSVKLELEIKKCTQCPFYSWEQDISCSNSDGASYCNKAKRGLGTDNKNPKIPIWCPLINGR